MMFSDDDTEKEGGGLSDGAVDEILEEESEDGEIKSELDGDGEKDWA